MENRTFTLSAKTVQTIVDELEGMKENAKLRRECGKYYDFFDSLEYYNKADYLSRLLKEDSPAGNQTIKSPGNGRTYKRLTLDANTFEEILQNLKIEKEQANAAIGLSRKYSTNFMCDFADHYLKYFKNGYRCQMTL